MPLICADEEAEYFCVAGLTQFLKIRSDLPAGQSCPSATGASTVRRASRSVRGGSVDDACCRPRAEYGSQVPVLKDNCRPGA